MGIFRSEPLAPCSKELPAEDANREDELPPAACRAEGIAAAMKLPPPAARNSLRAIPDLREFSMPSPNKDKTPAQERRRSRGHYTTLCGKRDSRLAGAHGLQSLKRGNGSGHGEDAFRRPLFLLDSLHKHFDSLPGVGRNKNS